MTGFSSGHFWAYSDRSVYEYSISDEKRNMWRVSISVLWMDRIPLISDFYHDVV